MRLTNMNVYLTKYIRIYKCLVSFFLPLSLLFFFFILKVIEYLLHIQYYLSFVKNSKNIDEDIFFFKDSLSWENKTNSQGMLIVK